MGLATILDAREILLLATGPEKADILARALNGPITPDLPASSLQRHPWVIVVADQDAAANFSHPHRLL
jgi:glucosamine-6-phosphate deaminase